MCTHNKTHTLKKYYSCLYVSPSSKKKKKEKKNLWFYGSIITGVTGKGSLLGIFKEEFKTGSF